MKIRFKIVILCLSILFVCSGCDMANADTTRDIRHSGFSVSDTDIECPMLFSNDEGYEKIKFFTTGYAITEEGNFYALSLGKVYKNGMNCKIPENFNKKVKAIIDNSVVKTTDGRYYYITSNSNSGAFSEVPLNDSNYSIYRILFNDASIVKAITVDSDLGYYYVLKTDGNVYNIVIGENDNGHYLASSSIVYSKNAYDGNIIDFNYAGNSPSTYIRTDTKIFRMLPQNASECSTYADVFCEYKIELDSGLSGHIDKIVAFDGNYLITNYGKTFSS